MGTSNMQMKHYDLMQNVNARGSFLVTKLCLPLLLQSYNPHILNVSPPLNMNPHWLKNHVAHTIAKYGMSMCMLGMAEEFHNDGIAINALLPMTDIDIAATRFLGGAGI